MTAIQFRPQSHFGFPRPSAPKFTARAARILPTAALVTTAAATYYCTYILLQQQYKSTVTQHNQALQSLKELGDRETKASIDQDEKTMRETLWWTAF
ncbi:hypothetical protein BKA59DRAFT_513600 [Fusarium tricinctum]|uniref:Uncharacterized protein n=1 Tax=Fusarium tricinctum TaxID=61284 RepID=A0A8K0WBE5_9HYPO|nr:hypothetical protein BKA59DRAFT_513600 [Fusarium tricinctum]